MMQVEVPTTLTTSPARAACADGVPVRVKCADGDGNAGSQAEALGPGGASQPAILSEVAYSPSILARTPASSGSMPARNSSGGRPPSAAFQSHLWPMAQTLRLTRSGFWMPQSVAAIMSQCSKALAKSLRFSGLCRSQWRSLAQPHSEL